MASPEPEEDFIPFSQFSGSQLSGPDSPESHFKLSLQPILQAFGLKNGKHKEGSFNITNSSSSSNYYSDQPHLIPILNSWERRIHNLFYVDRIIVSVEPLVPPPVTQLSPDASVLVCVVDCRFLRFEDALLWALQASPSRGKFTFSITPTHRLAARCPHVNRTFGLMIGMDSVRGVRVSWKLSYTFSPKAMSTYYTNGMYEQKEGDGGGGKGKVRHHQVVPEGVLIPKVWIDAWPLLNRDE
ncbi:hypothetical protein QJS04_geneDACA008637 [Acorus gramineus]|uniref:Uncharacterized protein n=1 Tax=Acorus gramineus TaxID=55184 RepID=A0AAV9AHZ9_ACOGR|nr:hypothetical protein QJS04_geneDACA008637 [Acorus gramineus]